MSYTYPMVSTVSMEESAAKSSSDSGCGRRKCGPRSVMVSVVFDSYLCWSMSVNISRVLRPQEVAANCISVVINCAHISICFVQLQIQSIPVPFAVCHFDAAHKRRHKNTLAKLKRQLDITPKT